MRSLLTCAVLFFLATPAMATDLTGCWTGHWEDCRSGHHGPLKGRITKCDDTHYRAVFTGRFYKVIPFRFSVVLNVAGQGGERVVLAGESKLGLLFGTFHYQAEATDHDFMANFTSRRYQGRFVLSR
jgi:hypothetical protein